MREASMKKLMALLLMVGVSMVLVGCGEGEKSPKKETPKPAEKSTK
jgi:hypothetical protein